MTTLDLSPAPAHIRHQWYHRVLGWDLDRQQCSTAQVELDEYRTVVIVRLASTTLGTIGVSRDTARAIAAAIRSRDTEHFAVLRQHGDSCLLALSPARHGDGVIVHLVGQRAPDWRIGFDSAAASSLAELLTAGAEIIRERLP
ncbi:hypothetical protein C1701_04315 [Actinoalloteichus sp. AHMU CJ021]|uniref:hypothetical protein n=1 Tax=Actinoalloteichus TaxID=65496 RepID=UPI0004AA08C7|nr:hypothetical protein [Actinoalloteichus caeruleus]AUS77719.1 hypothetical protein C1701_04315 [Actinoalloteichus sp. AHMU CJ021]